MSDDTETSSLREEQGKPPLETPAERLADVPVAPHSAGALGGGSAGDADADTSAAADRKAAEGRERR